MRWADAHINFACLCGERERGRDVSEEFVRGGQAERGQEIP